MNLHTLKQFKIPVFIFSSIIAYLLLEFFHFSILAIILSLVAIFFGSYTLFIDSAKSIIKKQFALDYIAILAIAVSIITNEYLVGMVIALMISGGEHLEEYGVSSAKRSLTRLIDRIPRDITVLINKEYIKKKIEDVSVEQTIFIRKGEVIPLDGILASSSGTIDESSLTGEAYPVEKTQGEIIRSGTINAGSPIIIKVTADSKNSTYNKIISLVEKAQGEKAPLVRLADKYSTIFTFITFVIAAFAYYLHPGLESVLAVLVVATPCPLIIATPIALLGGVNASAKQRIIVKQLASLESLARVNAIIFDKTGTITIGKPKVTSFEIIKTRHPEHSEGSLLSISLAIERNSLHPLAKAIVNFAMLKNTEAAHAQKVEEIVGKGITATVDDKIYFLSKMPEASGMKIGLYEGENLLGIFSFEDEVKKDALEIVSHLQKQGISLSLYTGDKEKEALKIVKLLGENIDFKAECSPIDKEKGIHKLKDSGKITAMVGDGINDAPALALADVGMVFSNEEQTAASEAADIVFLGGNFAAVSKSISIAKNTLDIAMQSILWGIGLSVIAMVFASFGLIPPIFGAILQEGIDVAVIINALRASK